MFFVFIQCIIINCFILFVFLWTNISPYIYSQSKNYFCWSGIFFFCIFFFRIQPYIFGGVLFFTLVFLSAKQKTKRFETTHKFVFRFGFLRLIVIQCLRLRPSVVLESKKNFWWFWLAWQEEEAATHKRQSEQRFIAFI